MLALTYPWIITVCFLAAIIIALKKHFWIAGGLVVVGFLLNWLSECFAFSLMSNNEICGKRTVRVMAWNIDGSEYDSLKVAKIADVINKHKPDVIFLSEVFDKNWCMFGFYVDEELSILKQYGLFMTSVLQQLCA